MTDPILHSDTDTVPPTPDGLTVNVGVSEDPAMVLERSFALDPSRPTAVTLVCLAPDDPSEEHVLHAAEGETELVLFGLLADTEYTCELDAEGERVWTGSFRTADLPSDVFPTLIVDAPNPGRSHADDGYLLFSHWRGGGLAPTRILITDPQGRIRWYLPLLEAQTRGIAVEWLGGQLLIGGARGLVPSLRTMSGDVITQLAEPTAPRYGYHHDARLVAEGFAALQGYGARAQGSGELYEQFLVEVTDPATGAVVWSIDGDELVERGVLEEGGTSNSDPYHVNALQIVDDSQGRGVWLSFRSTDRILRLDYATREVTDSFGASMNIRLVDPAGDRLSALEFPHVAHQPHVRGDTMVVFDNGGTRPGPKYSRVAAYRRDDATQWTRLWEHREDGWFEPNYGSITPLPDDHWLVGSGHTPDDERTGGPDGRSFVFEFDPASDEVVWRATFPVADDSIYRASFVPACELFANRRYCLE